MSVVRPEPKHSGPISTNVNSTMNQSELEYISVTGAKRGKTQENKITISFGFTSHWLRKSEYC